MKTKRQRIILLFKREFAPAVAAGTKRRTIRPIRKRRVKTGALASLREWSGAAYRSPQRLLRPEDVAVTRVSEVFIGALTVFVNDVLLNDAQVQEFALADGFATAAAMEDFFRREHGLPFTGDLIEWDLPNA
jgi:hypothetical protein